FLRCELCMNAVYSAFLTVVLLPEGLEFLGFTLCHDDLLCQADRGSPPGIDNERIQQRQQDDNPCSFAKGAVACSQMGQDAHEAASRVWAIVIVRVKTIVLLSGPVLGWPILTVGKWGEASSASFSCATSW